MRAEEESDVCERVMLTWLGCANLRALKMHFRFEAGAAFVGGIVFCADVCLARPFAAPQAPGLLLPSVLLVFSRVWGLGAHQGGSRLPVVCSCVSCSHAVSGIPTSWRAHIKCTGSSRLATRC